MEEKDVTPQPRTKEVVIQEHQNLTYQIGQCYLAQKDAQYVIDQNIDKLKALKLELDHLDSQEKPKESLIVTP